MTKYLPFFGIEYGRGCLRVAAPGGTALAPAQVRKMFPNADWTMVTAEPFNAEECEHDRFGENFKIQREIYKNTPRERHIMIGGDHSVNFGHFAALADQLPDQDLCLIYIDAHFDIHTPDSAIREASGTPHGTNVRAALGKGDARWLSLQHKCPALKTENVFYLGVRSFEPAEAHFVLSKGIYARSPKQLRRPEDWCKAVAEIKEKIGDKPYVLSFDFDSLDPYVFRDVLVPAYNGISVEAARHFIGAFKDKAYSIEFVEYAPSGDAKSAAIVKELVEIAISK
ncbi:MAG: arginase family protein [Rickettsiales bacterium]|jgi:arginase family enzyme|nr:arginase family protein [Rickettsiales bacterium]